jgi:hypothetical protein
VEVVVGGLEYRKVENLWRRGKIYLKELVEEKKKSIVIKK